MPTHPRPCQLVVHQYSEEGGSHTPCSSWCRHLVICGVQFAWLSNCLSTGQSWAWALPSSP